MSFRNPHPLVALAAAVALLVTAPAAAAQDRDDPFPYLDTLRGNVAFWRSVWSEWGLGQVAIHDKEYPSLVYEVVALPGPAGESYTDPQRDFVDRSRESWEERLRQLEARVAAGAELDPAEKALALQVATTAGSAALAGAHERVRTQRGLRERFRRGLEVSFRYDAVFREIFRQEGVPEDLAYLPHVESSFQPAAKSSAGALGMWQFTRGTGRKFMRVGTAMDERLDPVLAARAAARYMRVAREQLGSWPIALTSYNHGVEGMSRAVEAHGPDFEAIYRDYKGRAFGFASRNFYAEFLAARDVARDWQRHFPEGLDPEPPFDHDRATLERSLSPAAVARIYGMRLDALAALNPAWTARALRSGAALPVDSTVWLPRGTLERAAAARANPAPSIVAADGSRTYVVRRGDTLSGIAASHGLSLAALREMNGLAASAATIRVGQALRVGAATESSSARPTVAAQQPAGAPTPADGSRTHVVSPGDTLGSIARTYGISVDALRARNGLADGSTLIHAGQRLAIDGASEAQERAQRHVVRRGDTLSAIARSYGVRLADLLAANGLSGSATIRPGQSLAIPTSR